MCILLMFCFKQKTAYELRISDWSSDVCSSDLKAQAVCLALAGIGVLSEDHNIDLVVGGELECAKDPVRGWVDGSPCALILDGIQYRRQAGSIELLTQCLNPCFRQHAPVRLATPCSPEVDSSRCSPEDRKSTRLNSSH